MSASCPAVLRRTFWLLGLQLASWSWPLSRTRTQRSPNICFREGVFAVSFMTKFSRKPVCSGPDLEMRPSSHHLLTPLCYSMNRSGAWSRHAAFLRKGTIPAFNPLLGVLVKSFSNRDTVIRTDEPLEWAVSLTDGPALSFPHLPLHFWAAETGHSSVCA